MRIVLANQPAAVFGGSETYALTVAAQLGRLGHEVTMFGPEGAALAAARGLGLAAVSDANELPRDPDVVVSQDTETAYELGRRFAQARRVYVAHSPIFEPQRPPLVPQVCHAIVVLNEGMLRQCEALAVDTEVLRLRQPVDLERFADRGAIAEPPRRVLLFGNHFLGDSGAGEYRIVATACDELGLSVDLVGAAGRPTSTPELEIARADIVIGIGRCVVEAMACGRAAYVFGNRGADGWISAQTYPAIEARAFAGGALVGAKDVAAMVADLGEYDAEMGVVNRHLAVAHHDVVRHAADLVALFKRVPAGPAGRAAPLDALAHAARLQRETVNRAVRAEADAAAIRRTLEEARRRQAVAETFAAEAAAELDSIRKSWSWRLTWPLRALKRWIARRRA